VNFTVPESQRDSSIQPRVGEPASLPWVTRCFASQPQRGCITFATERCNPVGVENILEQLPRVVASLQPWAELRYPVGIMRLATAESEKAVLHNAVTATDQQIDQLVYELYGLTPEEIQLVEGHA
jgi:hypothetical protein